MTRIFKTLVVGGLMVGLLVGSLVSQATTITKGSIGPVPVPKTGTLVPFSIEVGGKTLDNAMVDNNLGGSLSILWNSEAWVPTLPVENKCAVTADGLKFDFTVLRPDGYLKAVFTDPAGNSQIVQIDASSVRRGYTATIGLCAE